MLFPKPTFQGNYSSRDPQPQQVNNQTELRDWKRTIRQATSNRTARLRFFELARKLVDGEIGTSQEMIKTLGKDEGLQVIRVLAEQVMPQASSSQEKLTLWVAEVEPFLRVITHQRVVNSAVLEQEVFAIYNFLYGIGGQRMKILYKFIIDVISAEKPSSSLSIIELSLGVLSKMLDSNSNNIVNQEFSAIVGQLEPLLEDQSGSYLELQAQHWLSYIKRRLGLGDLLPHAKPQQQPQAVGPLTRFVLPKNLPGTLSSTGPRHDNDHVDIENISILPTPAEITSTSDEYLPTNDTTSFHHPGIRGRIDREFRLLREDTVGQFRDAVRTQLERMQNPQAVQFQARNQNFIRTFTYRQAEAINAEFHRSRGLDLLVRFEQPARERDSISREEWWIHSKRMQPGGLAAFSPKKASLADRADYAYVHLLLAEPKQSNTLEALQWFRAIGPHQHQERCLVEFPGVLLPSFQHTLEALQQMSKSPDIPFVDLIAPDQQQAGLVDVPPPRYATMPDFAFDLSSLTDDDTPLKCGPYDPLDPEVLSQHSTLDATQSAALLTSLSKGLALIQGPPGTGKSYTGEKLVQVLLQNKEQAGVELGPILCVCYTNHALDQLLEHLLDKYGIGQIIRIGSRSRSTRLADFNLHTIAKNADRTRSENFALRGLYGNIDSHVGSLQAYLDQLEACLSKTSILAHLRDNYPHYHTKLCDDVEVLDDEGFQTVVHRQQQRMEQWLYGGARTQGAATNAVPRDVTELLDTDLSTMTHEERQKLYCHWAHEIRDPLIEEFQEEYESWEPIRDERDRVAREVDLRCLSEADVVGITTTGLAKNLDLLRRLQCKVLLCEEAGEVLEAHSLTALLPSVQHAIFIGDNLQLKPQIQNYELESTNPRGAQYSLDVSMFERLVSPPHDDDQMLPYSTLQTQRRMHPSISELVRSTLYHDLEDGGSVVDYPEVCGMKKRLFWFNHSSPEDRALQPDPTSTTHVNSFEIEMTVALVQHLVRQGAYGSDDIAVITPYLGQLLRLRRRMQQIVEISVGDLDTEELNSLDMDDAGVPFDTSSQPPTASKSSLLKSVRLATVDNFQGEEAKVVVISLVRSNEEKRCGFLSTSNRINVLLSRAKHGMYIIGNSETYDNVPMWNQVMGVLGSNENIGNHLELQCPRHPESSLLVSEPDHFLQHSPEGGCNLACDRRLPCGHACMYRCHADLLHNAAKCLEPCPRPLKGCGHACRRVCGDVCTPQCEVQLKDVHFKLKCGHVATSAVCWQAQHLESIACQANVEKTGKCHGKTLCPPCAAPCEVRCSHSVCGNKCNEPCAPCAEEKCESRFGDWYTCTNKHLFTLGESSMHVSEPKCTQCGAGVSGMEDEPVKEAGSPGNTLEAALSMFDLGH
ncbi:AAA domain-containing protein [Apiospora marii]|uniref:AAA domain-containing protein n=1 Tax=Apiospora marii TaxID=335849 RepID=UPI0031319BFA